MVKMSFVLLAITSMLTVLTACNNREEQTELPVAETESIAVVETAETLCTEKLDVLLLPKIPLDISSVPYLCTDYARENWGDFSNAVISPRFALNEDKSIICFYVHDIMSTSERRCDIYRYVISDESLELLCTIQSEDEFVIGSPVLTDNYICWYREFCDNDDVGFKMECVSRNGGEIRTIADMTSIDISQFPSLMTKFKAKGDVLFWQDLKGTEYSLDVKQ